MALGKKVLITGGAGFVGSHLAISLLDQGYEVVALDNLSTGNYSNIEKLIQNKSFSFIKHDIKENINLDADYYINLASPASPIHYQKDPIDTLLTSVLGTRNILELAKKNNATILQASTSEIYGNPLEHPQEENYHGNVNPIGPRSCYDEGKRCSETLCFDFHRTYGTKIKIIRIFNTYGPNMNVLDGRVVSNFIWQALNNQNITIYGDGSQTRSFQYISDLISGIQKVLFSDNNFTGPVNLGNPSEFTVKELANKVLEMIPSSKSIIEYKDLPQDDPEKRKPNINLAIQKLNWKPLVALDDGLLKTIKYFKSLK